MKEITSRTMTTQLHSRSTRWSRTRLLLGLLVVLSLTTAMHSHEPAADTNSPAAQVIALTNQARTAAGCASLATDHTLTDSAYTHAADGPSTHRLCVFKGRSSHIQVGEERGRNLRRWDELQASIHARRPEGRCRPRVDCSPRCPEHRVVAGRFQAPPGE